MSSSLSPDQYGKQPQYGGGGGSGSDQERGPLSSLNLGFLKSLTEKRTTRGKTTDLPMPTTGYLTMRSL